MESQSNKEIATMTGITLSFERPSVGRPRSIPVHPQLPARFRCLEEIGKGGMGTIYLAKDSSSGQQVVVKKALIPAEHNEHFADEAMTLFILPNNPHLPEYIAHGLEDGTYCLVMNYIKGDLLFDRLQSGPLSLSESLKIVKQAATGLSAAAGNGILHRDVKPENIMIGTEGTVYVIDFGVSHINNPGSLVGNFGYISPEQMTKNEHIDLRSDIFSLGTVFYEMIVGRKAFEIDGSASLIDQFWAALKAAEAGPSPLGLISLDEKVQSLTQAFVQKLTAYLPKDRFQTYEEVIAAAEKIEARIAAFNAEIEKELELSFQAALQPA